MYVYVYVYIYICICIDIHLDTKIEIDVDINVGIYRDRDGYGYGYGYRYRALKNLKTSRALLRKASGSQASFSPHETAAPNCFAAAIPEGPGTQRTKT